LLWLSSWLSFFFKNVACYNPYRYQASFVPSLSADAYSSMGDIDWAKRSYPRIFDSPALRFASMADAEWGWKKRAVNSNFDDEDMDQDQDLAPLALKRGYKSYKYRQPYMIARPSHDIYNPYQAYAKYGAISRPQTRKLGPRQYNYASMADMDWGWKKRSQLPALLEIDEDDLSEPEKRNLASLARFNALPHKRSDEDDGAFVENDSEEIDLEKRYLGSLNKATRSNLASMARNGSLRSGKKLSQ